jgi:DNA-binding transcriptional MerR regulator
MDVFWRISDFAKEVEKHQNTVDSWFKQMEEKRIHYINRAGNEKVYDELDLSIAKFISEYRDKKMALDVIFESLDNRFELRPFPSELESTSDVQPFHINAIKTQILQEIKSTYESVAAAQLEEIKRHYEGLLLQLPKPESEQERRQKRVTDIITRRRVEIQLEKEALHMWSTKPESERFKKSGLFRKEEDRDKRDLFIKEYINERFESRMLKEFGLND